MEDQVHVICPHCKRDKILGYNATVNGCDDCLGVKRDKHGYAWFPRDKSILIEEVGTGKRTRLRRPKRLR